MEDLPPRSRSNQKDPLERYTNADMPTVQLHLPHSLYNFVENDTRRKWWNLEGSKLLVAPFDEEIYDPELHHDIKGRILAAIADITLSKTASIAAQTISKEDKEKGHIPTTFVIYKLSETHRQILLQRRVWASINIAFCVAPLEPACPDFLFSIQGYITLGNDSTESTVKEVWNDTKTKQFFQSLIDEAPVATHPTLRTALSNFVNSMWISQLNIRTRGNSLSPEFNVYAKGSFISDTDLWTRIRDFLAERAYINEVQGEGFAVVAPHFCRLCHGRDHPKGLCPFPKVEGWPAAKNTSTAHQQKGGRSTRSRRAPRAH